MELVVYQDTTVFDELKSEWNDLLSRAPINNIFYTWEWHSTWWHAYHPGQLWVIAIYNDDQALIGIAPLFIAEGDAGRTVHIIGCVDVTDYLDFIVDKDYVDGVYAALVDYLAANRDQFDVLDFCNIPQDSITLQVLPDLLKSQGLALSIEQQEVCPIIDLPDDWSGYLSQLDKKQRHEVRRKLRRIQGTQTEIDWYIVDETHDLDAEILCFMELMAASDPEKAEFLTDDQHVEFFRNIVPMLHDAGWLQMNFLTVDGVRVAGYINFVYENRVFVYNSGLNQAEYGQLSPGIVLLAYNIQHAIEKGYDAYDFLRGNEIYKYRMGGQDTSVMNIVAR